MKVRGAILAGGLATRFGGRPKGIARVGGHRILDRVAEALTEGLGSEPVLIANVPEAESWRPDLAVLRDVRPGLGTLGGLYTAVVEAPAPVVCVAWDMPFVSARLIRRLADGLADWDVFLPASRNRRGVEPLCAAYGPACRTAMEAALERGDARAVSFHPQVRVGILHAEEIGDIGDPSKLFFNVNTEEDLTRAEELI